MTTKEVPERILEKIRKLLRLKEGADGRDIALNKQLKQ